jgi:hypothetical protein
LRGLHLGLGLSRNGIVSVGLDPNSFDVIGIVGDSYNVGVIARTAGTDTDWPGVYQWGCYSGGSAISYHQISSDTTPLQFVNGMGDPTVGVSYLSYAEYFAKAYYVRTGRKVLLVPMAANGTSLIVPSSTNDWQAGHPTLAAAITEFNNALTAAKLVSSDSRYVGTLQYILTNDMGAAASDPTNHTRAQTLAALQAMHSAIRSGVTGASNSWIMQGGMLPELWAINLPQKAPLEYALRDALRDGTSIYMLRQPTGRIDTGGTNLHLTLAAARSTGAEEDALLGDTSAPTISNSTSYSVYAGQPLHIVLAADRDVVWTLSGTDAAQFEVFEEAVAHFTGAGALATFNYILRYVGNANAPSATTYNVTLNAKGGNGVSATPKAISVSSIAAYGSSSTGNVAATFASGPINFGTAAIEAASVPATLSGLSFGVGLNLISTNIASGSITGFTVNGQTATRVDGGSVNTDAFQVWAVKLAMAYTGDAYIFGASTIGGLKAQVVTITNSLATATTVNNTGATSATSSAASASMTVSTGGLTYSTGHAYAADAITSPSTLLHAVDNTTGLYSAQRTTTGTVALTGGAATRWLITFAFDKA